VAPAAVREAAQARPQLALTRLEELIEGGGQGGGSVAAAHLFDLVGGVPVGGDLSGQVQGVQLRRAGADLVLPPDVVAQASPLDDLHRSHRDGLVEDGAGVVGDAARGGPAHVGLMDHRGAPRHQRPVDEDRRRQHHVGLVQRPHVGIVGDELVAGTDAGILGVVLQEIRHDQVHGGDLDQHVAPAGHDAAVGRHDDGVQVARFDGDLRAGDPFEGGGGVVVDVVEPVPDDLEHHRRHGRLFCRCRRVGIRPRECAVRHGSAILMLAKESTSATWPG
jgi:hypothetical protein